jgi:uncharacterized membrane protein
VSRSLWIIVHLFGVLLLFVSLGGLAGMAAAGRADNARVYRVLHGVALAVIFLAGFALLANLNMSSPARWGAWVYIKLGVWLALGASLALVRRSRQAGWVIVGLPVLGAVAAWAAVTKP